VSEKKGKEKACLKKKKEKKGVETPFSFMWKAKKGAAPSFPLHTKREERESGDAVTSQ